MAGGRKSGPAFCPEPGSFSFFAPCSMRGCGEICPESAGQVLVLRQVFIPPPFMGKVSAKRTEGLKSLTQSTPSVVPEQVRADTSPASRGGRANRTQLWSRVLTFRIFRGKRIIKNRIFHTANNTVPHNPVDNYSPNAGFRLVFYRRQVF